MPITKIGLVLEKNTLQSVYDNQGMTAIEVAAAASAKVDECVEAVNGVEQSAIEATAIVDEMRIVQEQFTTENNDIRQQLVTDNEAFIATLEEAKTTFETNMTADLNTFKTDTAADKATYEASLNTSKTTFEGNMTTALNEFEADTAEAFDFYTTGLNTSKTTFEGNMNTALTNFQNGLNTSKTTFETNMTNAVNTIIAEADADIITAVDAKIVELEGDGTLAQIINETVFDELNAKIDAINPAIKSVMEYGAKGDGVTFDDVAFQTAINENKVLYVPATLSYYRLQHKITIPSDRIIIGLGMPYIYNDTANGEPIFEIVGTSGNRKKNVTLQGLKLRNGTASTGDYVVDKDAVIVRYCDGFTITECNVTEIQGKYGVSTRYSTNITITKNTFYRCTYSHVLILPECENIHVEDNTFDTTTSLTTPDTYLFATGGDAIVDNWSCKNVWLRNNKFLNNPRWEAIDSHGAENIWIENNYIENVRMGIMVGLALGQVTNPVNKNIHINKNVVKQGNGQDGYYGIIVKGNYNSASFILAENVEITDNEIIGFGSTSVTTVGIIHLYCTSNTSIERNKIKDFKGAGIMAENTNWNFRIKNNEIIDATAKNSESLSIGIYVRYAGNDGVIENNKIGYTDPVKNIVRGIKVVQAFNHVRVYNNIILSSDYNYDGVGYYNVEKTETPTGIMGAQGDICTDANQMMKYYCTNAPLRFSTTQSSGISVSGTAGNNEVTITAGSFDNLLPGMEIVIAGAGAGGAALTTTILKVTNTKITLKTNVLSSVTNAGVTYTNAAWVTL